MSRTRWWFVLVGLLASPWSARAQTVAELAAAGRFEEAAALVAQASPQQADEGVLEIFHVAYRDGLQLRDPALLVRAMEAVSAVAVSAPQRQMLNFWHATALLQVTGMRATRQDLETARATLPDFLRVMELLDAAGDYPAQVNDGATMRQATRTFIDIQQTIIRRGY